MNNSYYATKGQVYEGIRFDSKLEVICYRELKLLLAAKEISDLKYHVKYRCMIGDSLITTFETDFTYYDLKTKEHVCREAKGYWTDIAKLRWKIFKACHSDMFQRFEIFNQAGRVV